MATEDEVISFRVSSEMKKILDSMADESERKLSDFIRKLLRDYIKERNDAKSK